MGTLLYAALQLHWPEDGMFVDHWVTVAVFELGKHYDLSMKLEELKGHTHPDKWYPPEAEDMCRYQEFFLLELPDLLSASGAYYTALRAAAATLPEYRDKDPWQVRVVFWRDQ